VLPHFTCEMIWSPNFATLCHSQWANRNQAAQVLSLWWDPELRSINGVMCHYVPHSLDVLRARIQGIQWTPARGWRAPASQVRDQFGLTAVMLSVCLHVVTLMILLSNMRSDTISLLVVSDMRCPIHPSSLRLHPDQWGDIRDARDGPEGTLHTHRRCWGQGMHELL